MKMVYTHENHFFVHNAQNIVNASHIKTLLKNEYAAGAAGDLAPIDAWLELWVLEDQHYSLACKLIEEAFNNPDQKSWVCPQCDEQNESNFEVCWQCQKGRA
jgi:hypothetical protein